MKGLTPRTAMLMQQLFIAGGITDVSDAGDITLGGSLFAPSAPTVGHWSRTGTVISPATVGDRFSLAHTTDILTGVLCKGTAYFLHDYAHATATGLNLFLGLNSGNFSMSPGGGSATLSSYNTIVGSSAFSANTTGYGNTGVGTFALNQNTTGYENTAVGLYALTAVVGGYYNAAFGKGTLATCSSGFGNVAVGVDALFALTTGDNNVAIGIDSMFRAIGGAGTVGVGTNTLTQMTSGSNNTCIGTNTGYSVTTNSRVIHLGYDAGMYDAAADTFYVDNRDRTSLALSKAGALLYGVLDATPANQTLALNAATTVLGVLGVTAAGSNTVAAIYCGGDVNTGLYSPTGDWLAITVAGACSVAMNGTETYMGSGGVIGFCSDPNPMAAVPDVLMTRHAAGVWALKNRATAQKTCLGQATAISPALTSGSTYDFTDLIPAGSIVFGVTIRVTTLITGATSLSIGTAADADAWGAGIAVAAGTTTSPANFTAYNTLYTANTAVRITAAGSTFTAGVVRATVHYVTLVAATS